MALEAQRAAEPVDQIVKLRGYLKPARLFGVSLVFGLRLVHCSRRIVAREARGSSGTRFAKLGRNPVECRLQPLQRYAGVLEFCHGLIVYRVSRSRHCMSTGQDRNVKDSLMLAFPPAVTIHGLEQGRQVLALGRPVTVLSAPGAALFAGALWWVSLTGLLRGESGAAPFDDILDCADAPGRAAEALRAGQRMIIFHADNPALGAAVAAMAEACGARVLGERPPSLDMGQRGAARKLAAWLG